MRRALPALGALLGLSLTAPVRGQAPPQATPTPLTLGVEVNVVSVTVVVFDKAGHFVSGLTPADIEVYEDGVRQDVSIFQAASDQQGAERIPLSVILVLDASGSMKENMHFLQEAAETFVDKLENVDQAMVVQFNESIKASAEFTGNIKRLDEFIESLEAWGGTSLYDAIHYSLNRIRDQQGRKALIVFSDGADTTSSFKERDVMDYARAVEATVYTVGIRGASGMFARSPRGFLRKIAKETGGAFFFPEKVGDLIEIFRKISDELHHHYLLAYTPKRPPDGTWRKIEVRIPNRKDLQIRVRKGYFALKPPRRR